MAIECVFVNVNFFEIYAKLKKKTAILRIIKQQESSTNHQQFEFRVHRLIDPPTILNTHTRTRIFRPALIRVYLRQLPPTAHQSCALNDLSNTKDEQLSIPLFSIRPNHPNQQIYRFHLPFKSVSLSLALLPNIETASFSQFLFIAKLI